MKLDRDRAKDRGKPAVILQKIQAFCGYFSKQYFLSAVHVVGDFRADQSVLVQVLAAPGHVLVFIEKICQPVEIDLPRVGRGQPVEQRPLNGSVNSHKPGIPIFVSSEIKTIAESARRPVRRQALRGAL